MDPIESLEALRPVLQSLIAKNLVVPLTPEGRGQVVTHNLYTEREMNELRRRHAGGGRPVVSAQPFAAGGGVEASIARPAAIAPVGAPLDVLSEIRVEVAELRAAVARLREQVRPLDDLREKLDRLEKQVDEFRRVLE
jgi:hypothetical protein